MTLIVEDFYGAMARLASEIAARAPAEYERASQPVAPQKVKQEGQADGEV